MEQLHSVLQEIEALKISSAPSPNPLGPSFSKQSLPERQVEETKHHERDVFEEEEEGEYQEDHIEPSPIRPPQPAPFYGDNVFTEFHTLGQSESQGPPRQVEIKKFINPTKTDPLPLHDMEASVRTAKFHQAGPHTDLSEVEGNAAAILQVQDDLSTSQRLKRFSRFLQQTAPEEQQQPVGTTNNNERQKAFKFTLPKVLSRRKDLRAKPEVNNQEPPLSARSGGDKKNKFPADKELRFKPKLNSNSLNIAAKKGTIGKRWERLHALKQQQNNSKQHKISKHLENKLEEEIAECSFQPQIATHHIHHYLRGNVAERTALWDQERALKLERSKQLVAAQELAECSFQPIKSDDLKEKPKEEGGEAEEEGWSNVNGIQKHLERQFVGRQARLEKEQNLTLRHSPVSRWKHQTTQPKEFHFELEQRKDPFMSPLRERPDESPPPRSLAYPIGTFGRTSGNLEVGTELQLGDESLGFDSALDILHNSLHDIEI